MDASMDMWAIWLSVVFTIIAGFLTAVLFGKNKSVSVKTDASPGEAFPPCKEQEESTDSSKDMLPMSQEALTGLSEPQTESECTAQTTEDLPDEPRASNQQELVGDQCEEAESENDESSHSASVNRMCEDDDKDQALRYMPGVLRTSQLEKMMSKEELEEEQRVQQEQLAAIFKLLKENQDTFGEVTEKDMEEQLKLYSI
ncbi:matrix-remodeling-associated protein 7 isoform X2 [Pangasianodon hypophthalmus]|uniref:matrix-remodeling-associated protein 7 isoform X2 n=1 Tax=Pangasianodon hypophthalmus TaxID=310915 RepID=UPI0023075CDC|nr:matrix-remodeling-associated protein 7 isoform X2 [Pangasianodon hypophthalmus]